MKPIIVEEAFSAAPLKIWNAITDKAQMQQWYFDIVNFKLEIGHKFNFYEPNGKNFLHECVITEIITGKKLQYSWAYPKYSKGTTLVTWNIIPENNCTKLILTHEKIENFADAGKGFTRGDFETGWNNIIKTSLKKYIKEQ